VEKKEIYANKKARAIALAFYNSIES